MLSEVPSCATQKQGDHSGMCMYRARLAAAEQKVARLAAALKAASPLTPFDFAILNLESSCQDPQRQLSCSEPEGHASRIATSVRAIVHTDVAAAAAEVSCGESSCRAASLASVSFAPVHAATLGLTPQPDPALAASPSAPHSHAAHVATAPDISKHAQTSLQQLAATVLNAPILAAPSAEAAHDTAESCGVQAQPGAEDIARQVSTFTGMKKKEGPAADAGGLGISANRLPTLTGMKKKEGPTADAGDLGIPANRLPTFTGMEMVVSRGALGGWVEQASPCCGAASVAGAWNALSPAGDLTWTNNTCFALSHTPSSPADAHTWTSAQNIPKTLILNMP